MVVKQSFQYKIFRDFNFSPFLTQSYMASEDLFIISYSHMEHFFKFDSLFFA